jgi:hypothetical protein
MKNKIALIVVLIFAVMQIFNPEILQEELNPETDFLSNVEASDEVRIMIKNTCYDCHSNKPVYPWYANIAPVSYWINDHIEEGSEHLNFSKWETYSAKKKAHKMEECYEELEEGEMPLYSYTIMHGDAQFSDDQKEKLVAFFKGQAMK